MVGIAFVPSFASATPSTTYWAPSTAGCQAWAVPHVTYDTYFGKGPAAGSQGAPNYPIDTGLTVGFLPYIGFKKDVTNYNVLHLMAQKSIPGGGYVSVGAYHGLSKTLFTNSEGRVVRTGIMAGVFSPDIQVGWKGLKKINLAADVQTGKNVLGAWGFGSYFYFADGVSLLVGPVFYFDKALQPGGKKTLWTAQLDVDVPLGVK